MQKCRNLVNEVKLKTPQPSSDAASSGMLSYKCLVMGEDMEVKHTKVDDEELARQYVRQVFAVGRETCRTVAEAIRTTTKGDFSFPVHDDVSFEISLAILGTSFAALRGYTQVMNADRGRRIEALCKRSIDRDYDLPPELVASLIVSLDEYQEAFQKSITQKNNPFGEISGIMLCRCLGPQITGLCHPGTGSLNPLIHQAVGDLMAMTITQTMSFWKGK